MPETRTVSFRRMSDGTPEDYQLLTELEAEMERGLPERLLAAVDALGQSFSGYQVSRKVHSLQSATRALRDGRSEEYVVAALLARSVTMLAPYTHGEMVAAVLKPLRGARRSDLDRQAPRRLPAVSLRARDTGGRP